MKKKEDVLTSEKLKVKFTNQFDMVNSAIRLARQMVYSEESTSGILSSENIANLVVQDLIEE